MNFRALLACVALAAVLVSGCATYQPVPEGYTGPTARITDSGHQESSGTGRLFYVESIDGNRIRNVRIATAENSHGQGFRLSIGGARRDVPIQKLRLKLVGTHVTAAPIHEMASRAIGEFFSVEGEIDFTPAAGKSYEVVGELTKQSASVWIEDVETKQPVTAKVTAK